MAAFSSNIDITSGGTYAMDVTNGETSSKVATDLNGKFANIQELLQNGLPEVWTGSSLPDSLPNGKIVQWNNALYQSNKLRILTQTDYNKLNNSINNSVKNIFTTGIYIGNSNFPRIINIGFTPSVVIVDTTEYNYHEGLSSRMTLNGYGIFDVDDSSVYIEIVTNGFRVGSGYKNFNTRNTTYSYIAFK